MLTLRLRCPCGRNLADVTLSRHNPTWTRDGLTVTARPNVDWDDFRPWEEANRGGPVAPGEWDWHDRTYQWRCKCGLTHQRRHERISEVWAQHAPDQPQHWYDTTVPWTPRRRVVVLTFDRDV